MHGIVAYTFLNVREKNHQFLKSIKKMHAKESWLLLSALRCRQVIVADQSAAVRTPRAHLGRLDSGRCRIEQST